MTTTQNSQGIEFGIVPAGGEFAVTNMTTGEIISRHLDRNSADRAAVAAMRIITDAAAAVMDQR